MVEPEKKSTVSGETKNDISKSLATIGIVSLLGVGAIFGVKKAYDWGYQKGQEWGQDFWKDTKERMEKRREDYIKLYGDPEKKTENQPSNEEEIPDQEK